MNHPFKLGGILFLITAICVGILSIVNQITSPIIAANEIKTEEDAMKVLITEAENFETIDVTDNEDIKKMCIAKKGSDTVGYVLRMEPNGYGGAIKLLIGIDNEGVVKGIRILSHSETPGFGANAEKDSFRNQFSEKQTPLTITKSAPGTDEIQAITGATITSKAITEAVNTAGAYVTTYKEDGGDNK